MAGSREVITITDLTIFYKLLSKGKGTNAKAHLPFHIRKQYN
jgi:hypothetical protein